MINRFIIYGFLGLIAEVLFTGIGDLFRGSLRLSSHTYLWMFPIYGLAVFLEPLHKHIRSSLWLLRGLMWAVVIFGIEYFSGWTLNSIISMCPWDYTGSSPYSINGYIRLDFLPVWFLGGLIFERIHDYLDNIQVITTTESPDTRLAGIGQVSYKLKKVH